jgi:superfamily II RNA helicase
MTTYKGLTLDPFQEDAIEAIESNNSVVVSAPTGSGKTLIADYIINKHIDDKYRIIYTAPIKALSNQKYKDFSEEYGESKVGLMTGDIVINPTAEILIMTTEIYRNMVMISDESVKDVVYVIFDEVHYINDIERGYVWEESIIYSPKNVRFLCLSATIPNAQEFSDWIMAIQKHTVKTITSTTRAVPLKHQFYDYELGITDLKSIKKRIEETKDMPHYDNVFRKRGHGGKGRRARISTPKPDHVKLIKELGVEKLPCLFFSFSRKDCQLKAKQLSQTRIFQSNSTITSFMSKRIKEWPTEVAALESVQILRHALPFGIGFHHAGLLPVAKELVEDLFSQGLIKVLYTTETFAVGINMPAKTVVFNTLRKYDGINFRNLNTKEYFQIAGRAGRRGIDTQGFVVSMIYRPRFDYKEVKRLTFKDVEPIKSQFKLGVNTTLNLLNQHTEDEIEMILRKSFYSYQKFGEDYDKVPTEKLLSRYNRIVKKLIKNGFIGKDAKLTEKGKFGTRIFANELVISEVFATDLFTTLTEYQILLLLGALIYEPREKTIIRKKYPTKEYKDLIKLLMSNQLTKLEDKFESLLDVTGFIYPVYEGKTFFDVLDNTNLLEGDMIRFYGQILDRIGQIKKASTNSELNLRMQNSQGIILKSMEGIWVL